MLIMDCELDAHFVNLLESRLSDTRFARVDSDSVEKLIPKEEEIKVEMSEENKKSFDEMVKASLPSVYDYTIEARNLGEDAQPILLTQMEFMRRYREMSALGGGMNFYGQLPQAYNVLVNMQHPLVKKFWESKDTGLLKQLADLALLGAGLLKGKELADFVSRSYSLLGK